MNKDDALAELGPLIKLHEPPNRLKSQMNKAVDLVISKSNHNEDQAALSKTQKENEGEFF
jgi:hypothetical protein